MQEALAMRRDLEGPIITLDSLFDFLAVSSEYNEVVFLLHLCDVSTHDVDLGNQGTFNFDDERLQALVLRWLSKLALKGAP